ncbi:hypothetical protein AMS68_003846 [Peltaster fructicola]|uniref:SnoaL-like domain-containing protein n=1 Tax=Peltaster fructicola TaxID=286661 RepID=A0A6H0XUM8_9PEZI|nr:hypothetical protein AMS68_003846 [Peltaster fructicola]
MTQNHTARGVLEAFYKAETAYTTTPPAERTFVTIAATLSKDFVLEQTSGLPYAGRYEGAAGMKDWMDRMSGYFSKLEVKDAEIFEREDSDRIVVLSNVHWTMRSTGQTMTQSLSQTFTMDLENGLIKALRPFYWDVHELNKALNYKPSE